MITKEFIEHKLTDKYLRHIHKLRLQLTDACNFRCFYCMPANVKFMDKTDFLTPDEIFGICKVLNDYGMDEIRLTGGEPTLREEFEEIVSRLSDLKLNKFGLTTNGFMLGEKLPFLMETNCKYINISLDSLKEEKFNRITRSNKFRKVYTAVLRARELGFRVKVNTVLLRGINDSEIDDFIRFSALNDIEVSFIELMKIGEGNLYSNNLFLPAGEVITKLREKEKLSKVQVTKDSTSFKYRTSSGGRIGFIASESRPFCNSCSRLRLSVTGKLRACIMSEEGINLRGLKTGNYKEVLDKVMSMKPYERIESIEQPMYEIGG